MIKAFEIDAGLTPKTRVFFEALLKQNKENSPKPFSQMSIDELRAVVKESGSHLVTEPPEGVKYTDFKPSSISYFQGAQKKSVPIKIYTPPGVDEKNAPAMIYFPGCGYVLSLDVHWGACSRMAIEAKCKIIMVEYPLAPENKYPAAFNVGYEAVRYIFEHTEEYGLDPKRIAIGGDSSGGNLAALVVNQITRESQFRIAQQILISPWTDVSLEAYHNTPFFKQQKQDLLCTEEDITHYKNLFLPEGFLGNEPEISPLYQNLNNLKLPDTFLICGEFDGIRGDTEAYADKLAKLNIKTQKVILAGQIHLFLVGRKVFSDGENPAVLVGQYLHDCFYALGENT